MEDNLPRRVLLLPSYSRPRGDSEASDEIGYGLTAGRVFEDSLARAGYAVTAITAGLGSFERRIDYIHACYARLAHMPLDEYDAVLLFHAFHQFPAELRRVLCLRGHSDMPLIGFTHGSHLDPTDEFRERLYPGMMLADFGNLMCLDRILVVSEFFRSELERRVRALVPSAAAEFARRTVVCGLALDQERIDLYRSARPAERAGATIVFNHSPTPAKAPDAAFRLVGRVMEADDGLRMLVTRSFRPGDPGHSTLASLRGRFGDRIQLGGTMSLPDYYAALWRTDLQISTAIHESFGVATLEAMYTGNCCLLPDRQSYPELTGGLGLYRNEEELEAMLVRMIGDPAARASLARRQQTRSHAFLPEHMRRRVAETLESVLGERHGGHAARRPKCDAT